MPRSCVTVAALGAATFALLAGPVPIAGAQPAERPASCVRTYTPPADTNDGAPFGVTAGPGGTWYADGSTLDLVRGDRTTTFTVPDASTANVGWLTRDHGRVWFADRDNARLGTVTPAGTISEVQIPPGSAGAAVPQGFVVDHGGGLWFTDGDNQRLGYYAFAAKTFTFYAVPSAGPLGLVRGGDGDLYFTERTADKAARFDPRTHLFTEWTLPDGAFPNRLTVVPDGSVWFTTLYDSAVWHLRDGYLHRYAVPGGPVGITYWHGRLWTALFSADAVARLSLRGRVERTYALPSGAQPLQVAGSRGYVWTTGATAVYRVRPSC